MYSQSQHEEGYRLLPRAIEDGLRRVLGRGIGFGLCMALAFCWLALVSWSVTDPSLTHVTRTAPVNLAGYPGAIVSDLMLQTFGLASAALLCAPMFWALDLLLTGGTARFRWKLLTYFLSALLLAGAFSAVPKIVAWPLNHGYGGIVGDGISAATGWFVQTALPDFFDPMSGFAMAVAGILLALASGGLDLPTARTLLARAWEGELFKASKPKRAANHSAARQGSQDPVEPVLRYKASVSDAAGSQRHWQQAEFEKYELGREQGHTGNLRGDGPTLNIPSPRPSADDTWAPRDPGMRHGPTQPRQDAKRPHAPDFVRADLPDEEERPLEFDTDTDIESRRIAEKFAPAPPAGEPRPRLGVLNAAGRWMGTEPGTTAKPAEPNTERNLESAPPPSEADERDAPAAPRSHDVSLQRPKLAERPLLRPRAAAGSLTAAVSAGATASRLPPPELNDLEDNAPPLLLTPAHRERVRSASAQEAERSGRGQPASLNARTAELPATLRPEQRLRSVPSSPRQQIRMAGGYQRPSLNLLFPAAQQRPGPELTQAVVRGTERLLQDVLVEFGIEGQLSNVLPGPVVTTYELSLRNGVNPVRVVGLADDIARAMSAASARIAVQPGSPVVSIELPNVHRKSVGLRELLSSEGYRSFGGTLPFAMGLSVTGQPVVSDLAGLGALLIAGQEGSGKSTLLRSLLLSLLYRLPPEDCRILVYDPGLLEFGCVNGIPHLLGPVLTEADQAVAALDWLSAEIDERAKRMAKLSARTPEVFNNRVRNARKRGEMISRTVQTGFCERTGQPIYEHEQMEFQPMPHIVLAIDDLAHLMERRPREAEALLVRIAQRGRAAGIHLASATKTTCELCLTDSLRQSFSAAAAFRLRQRSQSRTVIGDQGADQLLAHGDALLRSGTTRPVRLHTPRVTPEELNAVLDVLRQSGTAKFAAGLMQHLETAGDS